MQIGTDHFRTDWDSATSHEAASYAIWHLLMTLAACPVRNEWLLHFARK